MPVVGSTLTTLARLTLSFTLLLGLTSPGWADVLHFQNGKVVFGKLSRLTGDIIEFKEGERFGPPKTVARIQLTNRHDVVETRDGQKYFGEIIYVDLFKIDMRTSTGSVKLNRLKVINTVLGTPDTQMGVPDLRQMQTKPISSPALSSTPRRVEPTDTNKPMVHFPESSPEPMPQPAASSYAMPDSSTNDSSMYSADEDMDAIPAVDRMP